MSVFSTFNLDQLVPERFQELCCAVLVNNFSQLVEPHGRPGRDGGVDAELFGEAISYKDLINRPIPSKASDGSDFFWIFQVKQIRQERKKDRQRAIVAAMKKEVAAWKKKRGRRPTHYYLLTNINLNRSTKKTLKKLGKYFPRFECWGEEKIMPFILANAGLQNAFFPSFSNLSAKVEKLADAIQGNQAFVIDSSPKRRTGKKPKRKAKGKKPAPISQTSFLSAVRKLVDYEVAFLRTNDAFLGQFNFQQGKFEAPKDWVKVEVKSPSDGILVPSSDEGALTALLNEIAQGNLGVVLWQRYLGEETKKSEEIVTMSCHPDKESIVRAAAKKLFKVVDGENTAHLVVDKHLKELQSEILTDIKKNRIVEAENGLSELLAGRREYSRHKKQYPSAFYPNTRTFGRRPIFGWDFSSLWEDILTSIADVTFSGVHPQDLYRRMIHGPFHLCTEAIRNKLPEERFQAELATTHVIFRVLSQKMDQAHLEYFLDNVDDLAIAVGDIEHQVESKEDAEWAIGISKAVTEYIANLAKLALSGKVELSLDTLLPFIYKATSLHFHDLLHHSKREIEDWRDRYAAQMSFERRISEIRNDFIYALATYSWFLQRKKKAPDPTLALSLLGQIPCKQIVELYQSKLTRDNGWFGWWFNPEGKRAAWSSSVDHDIRDSLQLAILNLPLSTEDLQGLRLLEVESSYNEFVEEIKKLSAALEGHGHKPASPLDKVLETIATARKHIMDVWQDTIRQQTRFSDRKLSKIQETFAKKLTAENPEGALYLVETGYSGKATHYVGSYSIHDKVWFLEETGYSSYSVGGMGEQWADNILHGREQLLVKAASELGSSEVIYEPSNLESTLQSLKDIQDDGLLLLTSPVSIPWHFGQKYLQNEYELSKLGSPPQSGRSARLGTLDVFYTSFLDKGEFLIIPKAAFVWKIVKRLEGPRFEMIDPNSDVGRKVLEQNPDMDIGLKCLVNAREEGTMEFRGDAKAIRLLKPLGEILDEAD